MENRHRFVRVRMVPTPQPGEEVDLDNQISVDLPVDSETDLVVGAIPAFGLYGSPARDELYPFLLRHDGRIGYGSCADAIERYDRLNVRHRPIRVGEIVTYQGGEDWTLRIVAVHDIEDLIR